MATIESRVGIGIPLVFLVSSVFIAACVLVIFVRRWTAAKQSGGPFTAPFHIAKGMFYIHVAFCFKKRRIPLSSIRRISIDFMRGRRGGGARYFASLNKRTALRPCSSWEKAKPMMRCWRSYLKL